jgi:TonB family protein
MSDSWKQWEGQVVNRKFPLLQYLGGSEHSAVFLTERHEGESPAKAAIKLISATPEEGERQLSRWQQSAGLSNPHLIPIYEIGRFELGGTLFVYAVMECAEENLAQVLTSRALTPEEAYALLEPILDVLTYLHREGFVHGHIKPANIMSSNDQLKISSDGLRRAGESRDGLSQPDEYDAPENSGGKVAKSGPLSPASDVWSLGITLVEALTQNLVVAQGGVQEDDQQGDQQNDRQDPILPRTLPEPFLDIARHCLMRQPMSRWTVPQITARLQGRAPAPETSSVAPEGTMQVPPPPSRQTRLHGRPLVKRHRYAVAFAVAVGLVLIVVAVLVGPRVWRHRAESSQVSSAIVDQPVAPVEAKPPLPSPKEPPAAQYGSSIAKEERSSRPPVAVPALIHPETMHEGATNTVARAPVGLSSHGEIAHQVMPDVLQSARKSIQGTVKVSVRVNVNRSGNVEDAELETRGPSKYFARAALKAAQDWKFNAPTVDGRGVSSTWTLQFRFTRANDSVVPVQELP